MVPTLASSTTSQEPQTAWHSPTPTPQCCSEEGLYHPSCAGDTTDWLKPTIPGCPPQGWAWESQFYFLPDLSLAHRAALANCSLFGPQWAPWALKLLILRSTEEAGPLQLRATTHP